MAAAILTGTGSFPGRYDLSLRDTSPIIRSDGSYIRDYFYVEDAALAYVMLAEKMANDHEILGHAFNFSNEIQVNVLDLTKRILKLMSRDDLAPQILDQAKNEIPHQYLSAEKARDLLGWTPNFTLDDGLDRTIGWYRSFFAERS